MDPEEEEEALLLSCSSSPYSSSFPGGLPEQRTVWRQRSIYTFTYAALSGTQPQTICQWLNMRNGTYRANIMCAPAPR